MVRTMFGHIRPAARLSFRLVSYSDVLLRKRYPYGTIGSPLCEYIAEWEYTVPHDLFEQLVVACRDNPGAVVVTRGALSDAERDLHLCGVDEVVEMIGDGGLTDPQPINARLYENMQCVEDRPVAHAYRCMMGNFVVYLSVAYLDGASKFCVKSLKWHDEEHAKYLAWNKRKLAGEQYRGIL